MKRGGFSSFLFCAATTCFGMFPSPGHVTLMSGLLTALALTGGLAYLMHSRRARLRLSATQGFPDYLPHAAHLDFNTHHTKTIKMK